MMPSPESTEGVLHSFGIEELQAFANVKNNQAAFAYASDAHSVQDWARYKIVADALKFGTFCETDLITKHKHLPVSEWQDKEQQPREARAIIDLVDLGNVIDAEEPGAWSCKNKHVSGDYTIGSKRPSCAGSGNSKAQCAVRNAEKKIVRAADWDLPYSKSDTTSLPGYVLFENRTTTIRRVNFFLDEQRNLSARPIKHICGRLARILVFLKAEFQTKAPELSDEHFRSYFERIPVFKEHEKILRQKTELCGQVLYNAGLISFNEKGKVEW
jgi:hypothetical protein